MSIFLINETRIINNFESINQLTYKQENNFINLKNYLEQNPKNIIGENRDFKIIKNNIFFNNEIISHKKLREIKYLVFKWNAAHLSKKDYNLMLKIQIICEKYNNKLKTINPPKIAYVSLYKEKFFKLLNENGYQNYVPDYKQINSINDLKKLPEDMFPLLLRSNNSSGGSNTVLVKNKKYIMQKYVKMKKLIGVYNIKCKIKKILYSILRKFSNKSKYRKTYSNKKNNKIIGVKLYDNFDKNLKVYISYRVIMLGNLIYYCYPHVSLDNFIVHTNMENMPNKETYLLIDNMMIDFVNEHKEIFKHIRKLSKMYFCAFDVLNINGKLIFLEVESKLGCDGNYIKGPEKKYDLDDYYFKEKYKKLEMNKINFNNIFDFD